MIFYFTSQQFKQLLGFVFITCLLSSGLFSQKSAVTQLKSHICGVPSKQAEAPVGTPSEDIVFDRFGGSYSRSEMVENASSFTSLDCNTSGDFVLVLDDQNGTFTEKESSVICDVFSYLSDLLNVQSGEKAIVRLIKDSSLPSSTIATGSGYYPNECGLGHSLIHRQFAIGGQPQTEHGFITINPNFNYYYAGYEGTMNITDEIDFYTVILHEALHTMGFTSQISDSGAPEQDFYTQWDLGLTAPNGEPLILRSEIGDNECCATYSFNPATNLILPNDIINQSCGTTVAYNANSLAPVYADYGEVENIDFINRLSHLSNVCTTDGTKHVMNATIPAGEDGVQRTISSVESEILCSLGFEVLNGTCNDPNDCITIAKDDGVYYVGLGFTITIPFYELLANDNTNDNFPTLIENCGNSEGISVNQQFNNYRVTGNSLGSFSFCYSLNDCDGESCDVAKVKIVVTNPNIRRDCRENEDCQINPYFDFSQFGSSDEALRDLSNGIAGTNGVGNFLLNGTFNSPDFMRRGFIFSDYLLDCAPDSPAPYQVPDEISVVRFGHIVVDGVRGVREGIVLPLCEPIMPNESAEITFFGIAFAACIDQEVNLQIDFTELPPISDELIYDNPGIVIPSLFYPIVNAAESQDINERNTVTIINNSNACLNYLYMSASFLGDLPSDFSTEASVIVGDIKVNVKNDLAEVLNLTATPTSVQPNIGEVIDIEIALENTISCGGGAEEYPSSFLSIQLPQGLRHESTGDFPESTIYIDENELNPDRTYILRIIVDDSAPSGQELIITANMISDDPCYDNTIFTEITTITLCASPVPDFTAQLIDGECGIFNYFSTTSSSSDIHKWYFNEQTENNLFSMDANPTDHVVPDGVHTIIHVVEGVCETTIFELQLPPVNCNNSLFTCPCTENDALNIEAGEGTLLSQLIDIGAMPINSVTNKCLAINGHLIIDAASIGTSGFYEIFGSEVRMQPGSSITIKAGGALRVIVGSNGGIHGCESLWKGISLESAPDGSNGGRLYLYGAIIQDAVHAVELGDKSTFEMLYSTLNRNYIGIYMPPSSNSQYQTVFQPTFPHLSAITTTGELLPHYLGQSQNFENSYACIELNDCSNFQAGGGNLFGLIMSGANYGVVVKNSNTSIFQSLISDMIEDPLDYRANTGIFARDNSFIELHNTQLFKIHTGIRGRSSSVKAFGNTIGQIPDDNIPSDVYSGISMKTDIGNVVEITDDNKFYVANSGIRISRAQLASSLLIKNNTLDLYPSAGNSGVGINLTGALMSGNDEDNLIVSENNINIDEHGYGIILQHANGITLDNNSVNYSHLLDRSVFSRGIFLLNSSDNYLYDNSVMGTELSNDLIGIELIQGNRNTFCCNTIANTNVGTSFAGYCDGTKLRHTVYNDNGLGLQCSPNTRIGTQFAAGNMWNVSSSVQARHLGDEEDVTQSRFFVAGSPGSATRPFYETSPTVNAEWFINGPPAISCAADLEDCERPRLGRFATDVELAEDILQNKFLYGRFPETSEWEIKRTLYRSQKATKVEDQSSWSSASRVFFQQQAQEQSTLHKLTTIEQSMEEFLKSDAHVTEIRNQMELLSAQLLELDQTVVEGEEPSVEYISTRESLLAQKANAFVEFNVLLDQKRTEYTVLLQQLKQDNNSVSTIIEAATAMKEVNDWYFKTMAINQENLPLSTESALRDMAERCPQRFGSAVGKAQAILTHYDKPFIASDECDKSAKSASKVVSNTAINEPISVRTSSSLDKIKVFPNPTSNMLNIQLPLNKMALTWEVDLINTRGQIIRSQASQGERIQVNVNHYPKGLYWIRVQSPEGIISRRIIIQ